jgi:hypothetical protein
VASPPTSEWTLTSYRPYRTLTDEQVANMQRLQAWAHLRGEKSDLQERLTGRGQA